MKLSDYISLRPKNKEEPSSEVKAWFEKVVKEMEVLTDINNVSVQVMQDLLCYGVSCIQTDFKSPMKVITKEFLLSDDQESYEKLCDGVYLKRKRAD